MGNAIIIEPLDLPTITAETSAAGTSPGNLNNDWIGVVHRGTFSGSGAGVNVDFGAAREVDTVAFLSAGATPTTWTILASATNIGASDVYTSGSQTFAAGSVAPISGRRNSLWLLPSVATARYWSMPFGTIATPFEAGRLVMGKKINPAYNFSYGAAFGVTDRGGGSFSDQGVWLPRPGAKQRTLGLSFTRATKQEIEELIGPLLERVGNGKFVLVITDPDASTQRQRRMFFGPLTGNLDMIWNTAAGFEWRADLVSVI